MTAAEAVDTVVRGGTVVTTDGSGIADVAVRDGLIVAVGDDLPLRAHAEIDATGMLVLPGGVDVHTHFDTVLGGGRTADDFESGTRAAAAGGVTTILNFAIQADKEPLWHAVERELAKATSQCHVDFGLHVGVTDASDEALAEIESLAAAGFTSFKMFTALGETALNDRESLALLAAVGRAGCMVNVHAEDGALVDHLSAELLAEGRRGVEHLNAARPTFAEAMATARIAEYARATRCPLYVVHLSCKAALDAVRAARSAGAEVYVETRPAYLFLDATVYGRPDGAKFVTWPPIRDRDDQAALWQALRVGEIQCFATDHTTWTAAEKLDPDRTFADAPGGVANIQTSIGMLYNEGVRQNRIALADLVAVTATNPAKLFGLWPRKGAIRVGADADLCLIDPQRTFRVAGDQMESASDFDPYEGYVAKGWPVLTMSRGETVMEDGVVRSKPGRGQLLRRRRLAELRDGRA